MSKDVGKMPSRRQIFAGAVRNVTGALLAGVGAAVLMKRHRLVREGKCANRGICRGCEVFDRCGLPAALSAKSVIARTVNVAE